MSNRRTGGGVVLVGVIGAVVVAGLGAALLALITSLFTAGGNGCDTGTAGDGLSPPPGSCSARPGPVSSSAPPSTAARAIRPAA